MNLLWRLLFSFLQEYAEQRFLREIKKRGVLAYLRALKATRLVVVGAIAGFLFLQLTLISLVGVVVTGFMLWDHDFQAKLEILFWVFLGMFSLPAILLTVLLSERFWFKASGAQKMVDELQRRERDAA